jgi:hypothetical protein
MALAWLFCQPMAAWAQQPPPPPAQETADLARQLSNPIASLVSVPFQFNWEQNVGPSKLTRFVLNVQPVMPFSVNEDVNLIVRPSRSDVNQMFLQPFLAYQATHTITLTVQSEMTANWEADAEGETWTVPVNVLVSKLSSLGTFPASYALGVGAFTAHPDVGPSWKIRGAITVLLPRSR